MLMQLVQTVCPPCSSRGRRVCKSYCSRHTGHSSRPNSRSLSDGWLMDGARRISEGRGAGRVLPAVSGGSNRREGEGPARQQSRPDGTMAAGVREERCWAHSPAHRQARGRDRNVRSSTTTMRAQAPCSVCGRERVGRGGVEGQRSRRGKVGDLPGKLGTFWKVGYFFEGWLPFGKLVAVL